MSQFIFYHFFVDEKFFIQIYLNWTYKSNEVKRIKLRKCHFWTFGFAKMLNVTMLTSSLLLMPGTVNIAKSS